MVTGAGLCGEPEAGSAVDAGDGAGGHLSEASHVVEFTGTSEISVLAAWSAGESSESGVGVGHHLCAVSSRLHVPGSDH